MKSATKLHVNEVECSRSSALFHSIIYKYFNEYTQATSNKHIFAGMQCQLSSRRICPTVACKYIFSNTNIYLQHVHG